MCFFWAVLKAVLNSSLALTSAPASISNARHLQNVMQSNHRSEIAAKPWIHMISLLDINHIVNKLGCKKWKYVFTASKSLEMIIIQRFIDGGLLHDLPLTPVHGSYMKWRPSQRMSLVHIMTLADQSKMQQRNNRVRSTGPIHNDDNSQNSIKQTGYLNSTKNGEYLWSSVLSLCLAVLHIFSTIPVKKKINKMTIIKKTLDHYGSDWTLADDKCTDLEAHVLVSNAKMPREGE